MANEKNTAVKGYKINFANNTITVNYTFKKASEEYGTAEYELLKNILADFPFLSVADVLFSFMLFTGCLTVTLQVSFFFPYFAVMTAVPFFLAFTTPFEDTVATLFLLLVQVIFPFVPLAFKV